MRAMLVAVAALGMAGQVQAQAGSSAMDAQTPPEALLSQVPANDGLTAFLEALNPELRLSVLGNAICNSGNTCDKPDVVQLTAKAPSGRSFWDVRCLQDGGASNSYRVMIRPGNEGGSVITCAEANAIADGMGTKALRCFGGRRQT